MGVRRFFAVLAREFWALVRLNLLFSLFALPSVALFLLGMFTPLGGLALILSLAAAFPVGGALCAVLFCIAKMLRDDPGYLWHDFKRKLQENIRQAAAPGILCAAFIYAEIFLLRVIIPAAGAGIGWIVAGLAPLVIFGMVAPYIFLQIAYIELKTSQILRNSLLIAFANAGRSLAGALMGGAACWVYILLLPDSLPFTPLLPVIAGALSWLLNLIWVWPPVDKQFAIDATLRGRAPDAPGEDR